MATASAARLQKEAPEDKEENSERGVMRHSNREEKERKGREGGQASVKERGEGSDGDGWRG